MMVIAHLLLLLTAGSDEPASAQDPPLPFVTGEIRIIDQVGRDGRRSCFIRATPASFQQAAAHRCRQSSIAGAGAEPIAEPFAQTALVIRLHPEGEEWPRARAERGEMLTNEEAALVVRADGSVESCRSFRRLDRAEPRPWGDGVCNSLRRSGARPFVVAADAPSRRATISVAYYVYPGPAAGAATSR